MKLAYATIFDINYVVRAWALYRSLTPYLSDEATFAFYCVDDQAADCLERLAPSHARIIRPKAFETPDLARIKLTRGPGEFCWTSKPVLILDCFAHDPSLDWALYVDADMMAFSDPAAKLPETGDCLLTPHRCSPAFGDIERIAGQFNAGFAAFRNTPGGHDIAQWWLARNLEACPARPTGDIFGDQKYLDRIPQSFPHVAVSPDKGLNAAPWNILSYDLKRTAQGLTVDGDLLSLYHFQALRIHGRRLFNLYPGPMRLPSNVKTLIYQPYIHALVAAFRDMDRISPKWRKGISPMSLRQWITQAANVWRRQCNLHPLLMAS